MHTSNKENLEGTLLVLIGKFIGQINIYAIQYSSLVSQLMTSTLNNRQP